MIDLADPPVHVVSIAELDALLVRVVSMAELAVLLDAARAVSEAKWRAERDELWRRSAAKCDERRAAKLPKADDRPIVVQPGRRVEGGDIPCSAAAKFAALAEKHGYRVLTTHARRIEKGRARQSVVVRWRYGDDHAGWCGWDGDDVPGADPAWSFDTAQRAQIVDDSTIMCPVVIGAMAAADWVKARGDVMAIAQGQIERFQRSLEAKRIKMEKETRINVQ